MEKYVRKVKVINWKVKKSEKDFDENRDGKGSNTQFDMKFMIRYRWRRKGTLAHR